MFRFDACCFQRSPVGNSVRGVLLLMVACWAVGCDIPSRPPLGPIDLSESVRDGEGDRRAIDSSSTGSANERAGNEQTGAAASENQRDVFEPPSGNYAGDWETWDLYFIGDREVGYNHVTAKATDPNITNADIRYTLDNGLFVNQGKSRTLQRLIQASTETRAGQMRGFDSQLHVGPVVTRFAGTVDDEVLTVETARGTLRTVKTMPWLSSYRGLVAIEQSLRAKPMTTKDERRNLKLLLPGKYVIATARLRCSGTASVPLLDGSLGELIEINYQLQVDDQSPTESTIWTDNDGAIVRTYSPGMNLLSYRVDEAATTEAKSNLNEVVAVNVTGTFDRPADAKRLALSVTPNDAARRSEKPLQIDPLPGQFVRDMGDGTFQVLVSRVKERNSDTFLATTLGPTPSDSAATAIVDFKSEIVRRYADALIASSNLSSREKALELMRTSGTLVSLTKTQTGLVRASSVVQDGEADSTGRAIFLTALLRAKGIPARIAVGLKYSSKPPERMVYHAWVIAHVDGDWIHLDPGGIDEAPADRLMLATSTLGGGNEYDAFVPFLNAVSRMQLSILRAQY